MNLTTEQKEFYKKEICAIIDKDDSAFFLCGVRTFAETNLYERVVYVFKGDSEKIVRALADAAHKDAVKDRDINNLLRQIWHVLVLTFGILQEHVKIRLRNTNLN